MNAYDVIVFEPQLNQGFAVGRLKRFVKRLFTLLGRRQQDWLRNSRRAVSDLSRLPGLSIYTVPQ